MNSPQLLEANDDDEEVIRREMEMDSGLVTLLTHEEFLKAIQRDDPQTTMGSTA